MPTLIPVGQPLRSQGSRLLIPGRFLAAPVVDSQVPSALLNGISGITDANTAAIRNALNALDANNVIINEIGDSTTAGGTGVSPSRYNGRVAQLGAKLATRFSKPCGITNFFGTGGQTVAANYTSYNPPVTFGSTTIQASEETMGGDVFQSLVTTGPLRFTPGFTFDRFDFVYRKSVTTAVRWTSSTAATGTLPVGADNAPTKVTIDVGAGATWIEFKCDAAGTIRYSGGHPYTQATKEISLYNAGWVGSTVGDWTGGASQVFGPLQHIPVMGAHLTVINLCINDANAGTATATYKAALGSMIDNALLTGSVLVMTGSQKDTAVTSQAEQDRIFTAAIEVAQQKNVPVWRSHLVLGNYATALANGDMFDNTHPNVQGTGKLAAAQDEFFRQLMLR